MPGTNLRFADTPLEADTLLFGPFGGWGVLPAEMPATGTHGPSFLLDDVDPGDDAVEFRARITEVPAAGTFTADAYGSFSLVDAPPGTYTFTYTLFADGADEGPATETIVNGGTLAQFAAELPPLQWAGLVNFGGTRVGFAATLPPLQWSGAVWLNAQTIVQFAAQLPFLQWAGAVGTGNSLEQVWLDSPITVSLTLDSPLSTGATLGSALGG